MIEESLKPRIQAHEVRFREIETLLGAPDIASDRARFVKLTKEYKHLGKLMQLLKQLDAEQSNIDFYKEVIELEDDAAARESLNASEKALENIESEIKLFLVPADPEDDKNAILEIRAGTGGD
ncbi:MAG: PCRF domain-containing protein, partial [Muribaculaceae bacterium]|nr:PCRF domain-containing protein [Muribaculaceae bacterium]